MITILYPNGRGIVHTQSGGQSVVFPDICLTKVGKPVVAIAYTNVGKASDTSLGPTIVFTDGQMPMVKEALYSKSSGDEPGSYGGIFSGTHMDVCEFATYSFDVLFEGRGAARVGDILMHNKKNTIG